MRFMKTAVLTAVITLVILMACGEETPEADDSLEEVTVDSPGEISEIPDDPPAMTEEEKMAFVMENCICPRCPSWIPEATEKGEGGYCATGASECIVVEAGCICPECPVTEEMGLEWGYYCTRGSAMEMMDQEEATE